MKAGQMILIEYYIRSTNAKLKKKNSSVEVGLKLIAKIWPVRIEINPHPSELNSVTCKRYKQIKKEIRPEQPINEWKVSLITVRCLYT